MTQRHVPINLPVEQLRFVNYAQGHHNDKRLILSFKVRMRAVAHLGYGRFWHK